MTSVTFFSEHNRRWSLVVRPLTEQRAKINADTKSKGVQLQRHAAAIVKFQVDVLARLHFHTSTSSS